MGERGAWREERPAGVRVGEIASDLPCLNGCAMPKMQRVWQQEPNREVKQSRNLSNKKGRGQIGTLALSCSSAPPCPHGGLHIPMCQPPMR